MKHLDSAIQIVVHCPFRASKSSAAAPLCKRMFAVYQLVAVALQVKFVAYFLSAEMHHAHVFATLDVIFAGEHIVTAAAVIICV